MEERFKMGERLAGLPTLELERAVCESAVDELEELEEACRAFGIDAVREEAHDALADVLDDRDAARCDDGRDLNVTEIPDDAPDEEPDAGKKDKRKGGKGSKRRGKRKGEENAELGRRGEDAAARFLYRRGYDIVERNWKCAAGEADIIARDGDAVVFVEVKTRSSVEKGLPSDAVDKRKRERYEKIAALFLADYEAVDVPVRFDVVSLLVIGADRALVRHHINAFAAG